MYRIRILAATVAALALPLLGVTAASAAPPPPTPKAATLACQVTNPNCTEPVAAVAFPSSQNYVPSSDAALTSNGSGSWLDPDNSQGDGSQDWSFNLAGTVPHFFGGGGYGMTAFDRFHYGGDGIYQIEFTPFGQDTGKCLQDLGARQSHRVGTRSCDGGRDQAWIVHYGSLPFIVSPLPPYAYALSVLQSVSAQHHNCLTGHLFSSTTDSRCANKDQHATDTQRWSAIP